MTKTEAISIIKGMGAFIYGDTHPQSRKAFDMAIEALSADGDLISRADAITALCNRVDEKCDSNKGEWLYTDEFIEVIQALPSAEAKTKCIAQIKVDTEEIVRRIKEEYDITDGWILVSERLPDETGAYLVTCNNGNVKVGHFSTFDNKWSDAKAIAWMPLPKRYEGSESE